MMRLVKTAPKPAPATGLTMGGPPPRPAAGAQPGLTFAQDFAPATAPAGKARPGLRLAADNGVRLDTF